MGVFTECFPDPAPMTDTPPHTPLKSEMPPVNTEILQHFIDKEVEVFREDCTFTGVCRSIDGYLNSVLENVTFKTKETQATVHFKTCFVVGNSIRHISIIN